PNSKSPRSGVIKGFCIETLFNLCFILSFLSFFSVMCLKHAKPVVCSEDWVGVRDKCFYFSDDTRNWTASKMFCSLQKSELAQIDTQKDMEFLKRFAGTDMYWIGLSRKPEDSWKWTNGSTFNN
uniref:C-type lectin domain family 2 member A n=1 Tax=Cebus imitator TaxID=2715852 RepID=A0A2K5SC04_CEBIM